MASFPAPSMLPNRFEEFPEPGTLLTEGEALGLLRGLLEPVYMLVCSVQQQVGDAQPLALLDLAAQFLESATALLDAWHNHQSSTNA